MEKRTTEENEKAAESGRGPEKEFRTGAIRAAVWRNSRKAPDGREFEALSVRVERRYQDKDGNWQSTSSFRLNDLPRLALVVQKAYEYAVLADGEAEEAAE
jgi:hypothetical protein